MWVDCSWVVLYVVDLLSKALKCALGMCFLEPTSAEK